VRILVSVAAVGWVASRVDLRAAVDVLADAPVWLYWVPGCLLIGNTGVHALRVRVLLGAGGVDAPLMTIVGAMLRANFVGLLLPTGGAELAKIGFIARVTGAAEPAAAAILVARLLELIPWTLLLWWGLWWGLWAHAAVLGAAATAFSIAFCAVLATAIFLARAAPNSLKAPPRVEWFVARLPPSLQRLLRRLARSLAQVGADRPRLFLAALLTLPFALINCLVVWLILVGHHTGIAYTDVLAVIPAADAVIALPITIDGVGVRESLFVSALAPFGATRSVAVAVALTRFFGELLRAAVGGLIFIFAGSGSTP